MQDEEQRRMAVKRVRKLRKMRIRDSVIESNSDYADFSGRMNHRLQRFRKTMIEDTLPDNESDS